MHIKYLWRTCSLCRYERKTHSQVSGNNYYFEGIIHKWKYSASVLFSEPKFSIICLHPIMWFLCTNTVRHIPTVTRCRSVALVWCFKLYSQEFREAVCSSEHPEVVDDCPATVVSGHDLDADLPRPGPLRGLQASHYTRHTWRANQCPLPTAFQTHVKSSFHVI